MKYLNFKSQYNCFPKIEVKNFKNKVVKGYENIVSELKSNIKNNKNVVVLECYPGVRYKEIEDNLINMLDPELVIFSDELALTGDEITEKIYDNLGDDRVFGVLSTYTIDQFYIEEKVNEALKKIEQTKGLVVVYGFGASYITKGDCLVYLDLARWEIQQRFRSQEMSNWKMSDYDLDILKKYKRAFFIEWRTADRIKKALYDDIDYLLDTNLKDNPKMVTGEDFLVGIKQCVKGPFRLVPYFDSGVWGGQWMKEVCNLDPSLPNYAWSFDGIPEENSIYLQYGEDYIEVPSINVVFYCPVELLGDKVHARFGTEFPIRFDLLDTIEGGNLSLQVHPLTEYIQDKFGMHYTQDESYYLLDAKDDACVYLGVKEGINKEDVISDLRRAENGELTFPDELHINKFPAKKHDHFLIPAGTIHCSGSNSMVLEISATPYIFTFKLWDWGRLGLDGLPRPVHINHGENVIQWNRNTEWVEENLINKVVIVEKGDGFIEEKTGLHDREFIETRRHWFSKPVTHYTNGSVSVLNLVEGEEAIIKSPNNEFEPYVVHYAETFIIPASIKSYTIEPYGNSIGKEIATIKAYVRI